MLRFLLTVFLLLPLGAQATPAPRNACANLSQLDRSALNSFKPAKLVCQQYGEHAGTLHCPKENCKAIARTADEDPGIPDELTNHEVFLGPGVPRFVLGCTGISDVSCSLSQHKDEEPRLLSLEAELIVIPGDGCLYAVQTENADHRMRRKHCWVAGQFVERQQPFSYVGLQSTTILSLPLRSRPTKHAKVLHVIPPKQFVEVLVATPDTANTRASAWVLVRDAFGLVGWVPSEALGQRACLAPGTQAIAGFCQSGD